MSDETENVVIRELVFLFAPLAIAAGKLIGPKQKYDFDTEALVDRILDPKQQMYFLLREAGIDLSKEITEIDTAVGNLATAGASLWTVVEPVLDGNLPPLNDLKKAVLDIRTAINTFQGGLDAVQGLPFRDIGPALLEHLIARYLHDRWPAIWHSFCLLGVVDEKAYVDHKRGQFDAAKIWPAISAPHEQFSETTGWGDDLDHAFLMKHLHGLTEAVGLEVRKVDDVEHDFAPIPDGEDLPALTLALPGIDAQRFDFDVVAVLASLAADGAAKEGLVSFLHAGGSAGFDKDLSDDLKLLFASDFSGDLPFGLMARPGETKIAVADLADAASAKATIEVRAKDEDESTWLELGPLTLKGKPPVLRTILKADDQSTLAVEAAIEEAKVGISPGGSDGFIAKLIPKPLETEVSLTAGYDVRSGFYLQRGGGLAVDIPVGLGLGGVLTVLSVGAALAAAGSTDTGRQILSMGVSGKAKLGPLGVTVEGVGVDLDGGLPTSAAELESLIASFKPPTGLGMSIEAGPVKGGGFISRDPDAGQYLGALGLDISKIGLSAFGILDTKMPDGEDGFSLLVTVAGRFAPIPLGFGFTLSGVGGLLGLHRDVDIDELKKAVRAGTAGDILAPEDPIGDAPKLAKQASALFPIQRGQHVFGPTVKLGWGQPKQLATLDLALALTLPDPLRLILIGRVGIAVPDPKLPLVKLNIDTFGMIDFTGQLVEAEGRLFDSMVQGLPVVGGFALMSGWGDNPRLAFSVGGLHPAFEPPPGFAEVPRLGVDLSKKGFTLKLEGYFAITSNSVQLGARAMMKAGASGFTLSGELGFDALVIFEPFGVDLGIYARASVKKGSRNLCSVELVGDLRGPGPWFISGKAKIEILFFDVEADFAATIGAKQGKSPLEVVEPLSVLTSALKDPRNWAGEETPSALITDNMDQLVPPGATLAVTQNEIPLETRIQKVGPNPISGASRFRISGLNVGSSTIGVTEPTKAPFAPAQFFQMSDAEKLSAPGYEDMPAGVRFTGSNDTFRGDEQEVGTGRLAFIIDRPDNDPGAPRIVRTSDRVPPAPDRSRNVRLPTPVPKVVVQPETWQATRDDLGPDGTGGTSHAQARQRAGNSRTVARTAEVAA